MGFYDDAVTSAFVIAGGNSYEGLNIRNMNILRAGSVFDGASQVSEDRLNTGSPERAPWGLLARAPSLGGAENAAFFPIHVLC